MKVQHLDHGMHLSSEFRENVGWWQAFLQAWTWCSSQVSALQKWCFPQMPQGVGGVGPSGEHSGCNGSGQMMCCLGARLGQQLVKCDNNMSVVQVIRSLPSRDPTIMYLLHCLYYFPALHQIQLKAEHILPFGHPPLAYRIWFHRPIEGFTIPGVSSQGAEET